MKIHDYIKIHDQLNKFNFPIILNIIMNIESITLSGKKS